MKLTDIFFMSKIKFARENKYLFLGCFKLPEIHALSVAGFPNIARSETFFVLTKVDN